MLPGAGSDPSCGTAQNVATKNEVASGMKTLASSRLSIVPFATGPERSMISVVLVISYPCGELSEASIRSMASHKKFSSPLNLAGSCWAFSAALAARSALRLAWASESVGAAPLPRGFCEASQLVVADGFPVIVRSRAF